MIGSSKPFDVETLFKDNLFIDELKKQGHGRMFAAGSIILQEEAIIKSIFILLKGIIKVSCKNDDGDEMVVYYIKPGESCIMSFLGALYHERSRIQAEAIEDVELLLVSPVLSSEWLLKYPDWTSYFFQLYHKRFEELLNMVKLLTFENMEARILRFLVERARLGDSKVVYITHDQIAHEIAATRVVVSRLLKQLENNKQVILGRGYVKLLF